MEVQLKRYFIIILCLGSMAFSTTSGASTQGQRVGIWGKQMTAIVEKISAAELQLGKQVKRNDYKIYGTYGVKMDVYGTEIRNHEHAPIPQLTVSASKLSTDVIKMGNSLRDYAVKPTTGNLHDIEKYQTASNRDASILKSLVRKYSKT
jgi:hypothetical protein